jgi:hypothetical protein
MAFILLSSPTLILPLSAETAPAATTDKVDMQGYLNQLQQEIQKQLEVTNKLKDQLERKDVVNPGAMVDQFQNAYIMLSVKKTLYQNFVGTPSLQSPLVRELLLKIFQKDNITPDDLAQLEALVKQERPKYVNQGA